MKTISSGYKVQRQSGLDGYNLTVFEKCGTLTHTKSRNCAADCKTKRKKLKS